MSSLAEFTTHLLAEKIYREIPGLEQTVVWLCSRIGAPIDQPQVAAVQVTLKAGTKISDIAELARQIVKSELERMPEFCMELARGEYPTC